MCDARRCGRAGFGARPLHGGRGGCAPRGRGGPGGRRALGRPIRDTSRVGTGRESGTLGDPRAPHVAAGESRRDRRGTARAGRVPRMPRWLRQPRHGSRAWYCPFTLASGSDPTHESPVALLEGDVVVRRVWCAGGRLFRQAAWSVGAAAAAPSEELHPLRDDLGDVPPVAVLVVVLAGGGGERRVDPAPPCRG